MKTKKTQKKINKSPKDTTKEAEKLLNRKLDTTGETLNADDDSSDEEILVRTGNVPRKWYDEYEHSGYDIKSNKVIKPKEEDEIEKFMKKAEDKNWWRNIYDEMNNKTIFISDKDMALIKRIRNNMFASRSAGEDDYFERDIPYQIHPVNTIIPSKRSFGLSKNERKAINRIIYAINNGFIKWDDEIVEQKERLYDLWTHENTAIYQPGKGFQAPKRDLPDVDESYNPPEELLNGEYIKKYDCLRKIPKYDKNFDENFDRLCDLFMSARMIKKKQDIREEDILPQLPKPEELKPFPTKENIIYKGHESSIRSMIIEPNGKFLISADNAGFIYIWDIATAKIIKRIDVSDTVESLVYNTSLNLITICGKEKIYFLIPSFLTKKLKKETLNLIETKVKPLIKSKNENQGEDSEKSKSYYEWKVPKSGSIKEKNGILFYLKWKDGVLLNMAWHNKGDYFATLSKNSLGKTQVYIHSLSRLVHQAPFSKISGNINTISFHPNKPYFLVATNSNIFVYNLQKQVNYLINP